MLHKKHVINFRLTDAEFERYSKMIGHHAFVHKWSGLCVFALEQLAASRQGPWSTPIEQEVFSHRNDGVAGAIGHVRDMNETSLTKPRKGKKPCGLSSMKNSTASGKSATMTRTKRGSSSKNSTRSKRRLRGSTT